LLAPFGERVYRIALAAKWVLILVCVVVGIIDLVAKLARIAERLIPCEAVYRELFNAPCDAKLLARCPFTAPLANLVLRDMGDLSVRAGSLLDVTLEYLGLCTDLTYLLLVAVLLSGLPRRLWQQIAFSLSSLIGQGKAQTALNRSANEFVHKYGKHWIVAVRDGKTYHAPCIRRQHRYLPRETFTTGSLEEVVRETYVFASRDEALIQVRRLLKGVNNYLVTQYKRRR
jgi:hypothetical protein